MPCRTRRAAFRPSFRWRFIRRTRRSTISPVTTGLTDIRQIAVSRLLLDNFPHIKAYWQMMTPKIAQIALRFGADDLDGTVIEEKIYHDAGATTPQGMTRKELCRSDHRGRPCASGARHPLSCSHAHRRQLHRRSLEERRRTSRGGFWLGTGRGSWSGFGWGWGCGCAIPNPNSLPGQPKGSEAHWLPQNRNPSKKPSQKFKTSEPGPPHHSNSDTYCLAITPPFITKLTCSVAEISSSGLPGTAMMSAK